jgi:hypothetical protein
VRLIGVLEIRLDRRQYLERLLSDSERVLVEGLIRSRKLLREDCDRVVEVRREGLVELGRDGTSTS